MHERIVDAIYSGALAIVVAILAHACVTTAMRPSVQHVYIEGGTCR